MKQYFQPLGQHKGWLVLGGFCVLGVALIGYGLSPSSPECQSNMIGLSCAECLAANAASSGIGSSISGCLPFPFAMRFYDNFNKFSLLAGFVVVFMTGVAGVKLSSLGQVDRRYR